MSSYFPRAHFPEGEPSETYDSRRLRETPVVVVFLGEMGWTPKQLRLLSEAQEMGKTILPVLIGEASAHDLDGGGGLFRDRSYSDLRSVTPDQLDLLANQIKEMSQSPALSLEASLEEIVAALIHGDEGKRSDTLQRILGLSGQEKSSLGRRLCQEILGRFRPWKEGQNVTPFLAPEKIPSVRSWMLSSLIWADAESPENRACILDHLRSSFDPNASVRFWCLAGLYQKPASYLAAAIGLGNVDPDLAVAALAAAIAYDLAPADHPEVLSRFRGDLRSTEFARTMAALRALRIVARPELARELVSLLKEEKHRPLDYDAL